MRSRATTWVPALLLGCALTFLGCGSSRDPTLAALGSDPLATATFPHTTLVSDSRHGAGTTLGKPVYATIVRRFSYQGVSEEELVTTVAAAARRHGWHTEFSRPTSYTGSKAVGAVDETLTITTSDLAGGAALFVYLTAR